MCDVVACCLFLRVVGCSVLFVFGWCDRWLVMFEDYYSLVLFVVGVVFVCCVLLLACWHVLLIVCVWLCCLLIVCL